MVNTDSRVVLVTGGTRGIGAAMVSAFRLDGWRVAAWSRSSEPGPGRGADLYLRCDVSSAADVQEGVACVLASLGRLDAVVNNAGVAAENSLEVTASDELWNQILAVNLTGPYLVTKHCLPHLPDRSGRIINIASVLALKGAPEQSAYCAAKHGLLGFTRALAHYVARRGITANAICPGWVRTHMGLSRMRELGRPEEQLVAAIPIGRWVEADEVARLAVYLASDAAGAITGQALTIDGGTWP